MKRLCMERNSTTGGGLMKRNNVNRVLLNDFLGADYADYMYLVRALWTTC